MIKLHINIVTYIPKGESKTLMEIKDTLLPTLLDKDFRFNIQLNVLINNSNEESDVETLRDYLTDSIEKYGSNANYSISTSTENDLMKARNRLFKVAFKDPDSLIMQLDDDDRMLPNWKVVANTIIHSPLMHEDRLNFYMFRWERDDGDFMLPKDIKLKPLSELGKSTFTFSNWGWITKTTYIMNNQLMFPEFMDTPKLDDNFFHIKSHLMNPHANFILTPLYVWNNRHNKGSVSNRKREFVDKLMEYFKSGNPGYIMTPYIIRSNELERFTEKDMTAFFPEDLGPIECLIKGYEHKVKVDFIQSECCYKYKGMRLKSMIRLDDYMRDYSTFQLRMLGESFGGIFSQCHGEATIPIGRRVINGAPDKSSEWNNVYLAEFE